LRRDYPEYQRRQTEVIVIGPEDAGAFASYWREHRLPFTGLPDPRGKVLKLYGQEVSLFKLGRMPAQALVDRQGVVRFAYYGMAMMDIPETCEVLQVLDTFQESPGEEIRKNQEQ